MCLLCLVDFHICVSCFPVAALSVAYLSSTNREFVYIVVGVLINIMSDPDNRPILKQEKGVQRLIELLNDIGPNDWQLSAMICQLLMNYSERIGNKNTAAGCAFELDEKYIIGKILSELLGSVSVFSFSILNVY